MADSGKMLMAGVAAAGVAAVVCCLTKDSPKSKTTGAAQENKPAAVGAASKVEEISKDTVCNILKEIIESQEKMKSYMKTMTAELKGQQMDFKRTYDRVKEVQPDDPLEKYGLNMMEFDQLLDKYQSDPTVRDAISKIMGAPAQSAPNRKAQEITTKQIVRIHEFMLEELERIVKEANVMNTGSGRLDMKTVTIAAQAMVGAKVEQKFSLAQEDVESAVLLQHTTLATDQEFASVNMKIQHTMGQLMGGVAA